MSMGMMTLPPVVVSLPFKLIFFVLVDGWSREALCRATGGKPADALAGGAELTFATRSPRLLDANADSKTPPAINILPMVLVRHRPPAARQSQVPTA
jgi:hypothetical protein